ncbi:hypothetical protein AAGG49_22600, partial [Stenotrophomonas maltophilia]|uniref:hypothetical protein n=1 Tax=Stenotrophomonas maltophilia TaxID=40324 RepID=UPI00313EC1C6
SKDLAISIQCDYIKGPKKGQAQNPQYHHIPPTPPETSAGQPKPNAAVPSVIAPNQEPPSATVNP